MKRVCLDTQPYGFSASEVLANHKSVLTSFEIEISDDELDLSYIYWITKMHKHIHCRFIQGLIVARTF